MMYVIFISYFEYNVRVHLNLYIYIYVYALELDETLFVFNFKENFLLSAEHVQSLDKL